MIIPPLVREDLPRCRNHLRAWLLSQVADDRRFDIYSIHHNIRSRRKATISEWPPKWFLKLSAADRPLRCMVLFWLFFVLVLVLVLVRSIDRSIEHAIVSFHPRLTRCSGGNSVMDRLMETKSMIRELWNGGLWAVTQVASMPCTRSVRLRAQGS